MSYLLYFLNVICCGSACLSEMKQLEFPSRCNMFTVKKSMFLSITALEVLCFEVKVLHFLLVQTLSHMMEKCWNLAGKGCRCE